MANTIVKEPIAAPEIRGKTKTPEEDDTELIEWDIHIENPPRRPAKTVRLNFVRAGYRPPKIADNPED